MINLSNNFATKPSHLRNLQVRVVLYSTESLFIDTREAMSVFFLDTRFYVDSLSTLLFSVGNSISNLIICETTFSGK